MIKIILQTGLFFLVSTWYTGSAQAQTHWYTLSCRFANVTDEQIYIRVSRIGMPTAHTSDADNQTYKRMKEWPASKLNTVKCLGDKDSETAEIHISGHDVLLNNVIVVTATHGVQKMKVAFEVTTDAPVLNISLGTIEFVPGDYLITPLLQTKEKMLAPAAPLNPLPHIPQADFSIINKALRVCN